ncbi:MAG: replicative DNA helicase [Gemmataceae bacterium]
MSTDTARDALAVLVEGRSPPHSIEAERCLLGSMLRDNSVIGDVLQIVREENFYREAHRRIFQAMVVLYDRGHPVDLVTLGEELRARQCVEDIGGYAYLAELWEAAPTAAHAEHYARIVHDKATLRNLIRASTEVLREAYDQTAPADELLETAERKILQIAEWGVTGQTVTLSEALSEAYDRIDARHMHGESFLSGLPTGFVDLDERIAGLQNSELIIVAARPSVGKTAFALNIARHVALSGKAVFFVSLEQSKIEIAERLLCAQAQVDSHKLRKGMLTQQEIQRLIAASGELRSAPMFIDDSPGQSMLRIAANARRLKLRHHIRLVIVDYLQLVEPENRRDSRQEQVAAVSRRLKSLAKELQIPVLACAQLNRAPEDRTDHRPRLSDLRESGAIEQDADVVMLLHRPEVYDPGQDEGTVELIVAKQRNGPIGEVRLTYIKHFMRFENYAVPSPFEG